MRIYSMTATFGKLEHQTLTLEPGLNILEAPNEWGKSTWCAFLTAMLYGLETRAKSTKTSLAEKEKYAPWSGHPMEGSMDLNWNGRDITIQRRTQGRVPMGAFRAFETATGLPVPELTAANCGQTLLGVERSVFLRAGFLRLADLPVTQDEALRRRLNALVTTGDDSGEADRLGQKLRDLKNRCRYNRTGLLPQAESALREQEEALNQLRSLDAQCQRIRTRQRELEEHMARLKNHQAALAYADAQSDAGRVATAQAALDYARRQEETQEFSCRDIPSREEAEKTIRTIHDMHQQWLSLQMESQMLPQPPKPPEVPPPFRGVPPQEAVAQAEADARLYAASAPRKSLAAILLWAAAVLALCAGGALLALSRSAGLPVLAGGCVLLLTAIVVQLITHRKNARLLSRSRMLEGRYGSGDSEEWIRLAEDYGNQYEAYRSSQASCDRVRGDLEQRIAALDRQAMALTGGQDLQAYLDQWQQVRGAWQACDDARRNRIRLESQVRELQAMARTARKPDRPDDLTHSPEETNRLISDCATQQRQLQLLLGQCQGKMEALGSEEAMIRQIDALKARIARLEETFDALDIAQRALAQASSELQRRFAPRIASRAKELFQALTGGRYGQLTIGEDLALSVGAQGEDTLRSAQWRSDGTVDQLYLALRLAVSEALTPEAPLILDDALVRFDDTRLAAAMAILKEEARDKQVLLFTCQSREKQLES